MTQPPDDAALVAQNRALRTLNALLEHEIADHRGKAQEYHAAIQTLDSEREANAIVTTALEAKDRRIAELSGLLKDCADELEAEVQGSEGIGDHPAMFPKLARDLATVVASRAALKPSDKGEGRWHR